MPDGRYRRLSGLAVWQQTNPILICQLSAACQFFRSRASRILTLRLKQFRDKIIHRRPPDVHGMDLIRKLFVSV